MLLGYYSLINFGYYYYSSVNYLDYYFYLYFYLVIDADSGSVVVAAVYFSFVHRSNAN